MGVAFDTCVRSRCTLSPKVARRCVRENSTFRARWTMVKVRDKDAKRHDCNTFLFHPVKLLIYISFPRMSPLLPFKSPLLFLKSSLCFARAKYPRPKASPLSTPLLRLREFIAHSVREYTFWHLDLFPKPTLHAFSYCRLSDGHDRLGAYHLCGPDDG
jgi:hypothetical protein